MRRRWQTLGIVFPAGQRWFPLTINEAVADDPGPTASGLAAMTRKVAPWRARASLAAAAALAVPLGIAGTASAARASPAAPSAGAVATPVSDTVVRRDRAHCPKS